MISASLRGSPAVLITSSTKSAFVMVASVIDISLRKKLPPEIACGSPRPLPGIPLLFPYHQMALEGNFFSMDGGTPGQSPLERLALRDHHIADSRRGR